MTRGPQALGQIAQWPGGFAMNLGLANDSQGGVVTCCAGHPTPTEAKNHGLARLVEVAVKIADRDIAAWARGNAS